MQKTMRPGDAHLGRLVDEMDLDQLAAKLGMTIAGSLDVLPCQPDTPNLARVQLLGTGLTLTSAIINNARRIELKNYTSKRLNGLLVGRKWTF